VHFLNTRLNFLSYTFEVAISVTLPRTPIPVSPFQTPTHRPAGTTTDDQYAGSAAATPPEASLRAHALDQARRTSLATSLLDAAGPGAPTAAERSALVASLSKVDPAVLEVANSNQIRIGVVNKGDDFLAMGALKPRTFQEYQQKLPQMREAGDRAAAIAAQYDKRLEEQSKKLPKPKPDQGFGGFNQSAEQQQKFLLLSREKQAAINEALGDKGAIPFTVPQTTEEIAPMGMGMAMMPNPASGPKPTALMAAMAGANTPEQRQEYESLLAGINGKRLTEARAESLKSFETHLSTLPPQKQAEGRATLAKLKENPSMIVIDHERHNIFAPDLFYSKDGKRLNLHDATTLKSWADDKGRSRGSWDLKTNPQGSLTDGQYFQETNRILIQGDALRRPEGDNGGHGDTAVHELGHGLEDVMRSKDPQFHASWVKKLEEAHRKAAGPGMSLGNLGSPLPEAPGTVTQYALTNPREYLAEGISHFYDDPKLLKAKDPALYGLTHQFLEHVKTLK